MRENRENEKGRDRERKKERQRGREVRKKKNKRKEMESSIVWVCRKQLIEQTWFVSCEILGGYSILYEKHCYRVRFQVNSWIFNFILFCKVVYS